MGYCLNYSCLSDKMKPNGGIRCGHVLSRYTLYLTGTGNTVVRAVNVLQEHGVLEENIIVLNLFSTPSGNMSLP